MARNVTKGNVKIDGQEYLIDEKSYQVSEAPGIAPQIVSGTPGYQDHIIFKNDAQSLWFGGYDFDHPDNFENPTTFKDSRSIDVFRRSGEARLSRRLDEPSIILLATAGGAQYTTNTKAGFDEGTFSQAESTTTPDIRLSFDSATSTYTTKETFAGGGLDSEFTKDGSGTFDESGGNGRLRVNNGQRVSIRGTTTTIKGFKATSIGRSTGTQSGYSDFYVAMTDTDFNDSSTASGNYVIFHWLNDVNDLEIKTGGSSYGSFYQRLSGTNGVTVEVKEVNGSQIEIYVNSTLYKTISSSVATGTMFLWSAYNGATDSEMIMSCDQIDYWSYDYYSSGTWKSASYVNTGSATDSIGRLTLIHNSLSASAYIDQIAVYDTATGSPLSVRTTNVTSGVSSTYTGLSTDGWSVQWTNAALDDKDVNIKLTFAKSGTRLTPKVTEARVLFSTSTTTPQSIDGLIVWNSDLWLWGSKQAWKTVDGSTWTNQVTAVSPINDAEAFEGRLYLAEPTYGYQFTATGTALTARTGASGFAADYFTGNSSGASGRLYAVDDNKIAYSSNPEVGFPTWTTAFIHRGSAGETFFLGKPEVHNRFVYYTVNRGDTTNGPGSLWLYDHNNGTSLKIAEFDMPISKKIKSFNGRLYFCLLEKNALIIKALDGGSVLTVKRIELSDATFQDPIEWKEYEEKLHLTAESSSATSFQYQYDPRYDQGHGEGWVRLRSLSNNNANGEYVMGVLDREVYIGDDDGQVRKISTSYHTSGNLTSSLFDAGQFKINKKWIELEVHHDPLPSNTSITIAYALDGSTTFTNAEGSGTVANSTSFVARIPESTNVGHTLQYKVTLNSTDGTNSPVIKDIIIRYQLIEPFRKQWQFGVVVSDSIEYLDGSRETLSAADLLNTLYNSRRNTDTGTIDFYDIDETLHKVDYMRVGAEVPTINPDQANQDYLVGVQLVETQTEE